MISQQAVDFLLKNHPVETNVRKISKLPYAVHCFAVLNRLAQWGITDEDTLYAGLFHDVIEENPSTDMQIFKELIGDSSVNIVHELTFVPDDLSPKKEQKAQYMSSFRFKTIKSVTCKVADRLSNVDDFFYPDFAYAKKYWEKAEDFINIVYNRRKEISSQYGKSVWHNIATDINNLTVKINSYE